MNPEQKIARILRTDKDVLIELKKKAEILTGKMDVFEDIVKQNDGLINDRFKIHKDDIQAEEIESALIDKIRQDDIQLFNNLSKPSFMLKEDIDSLLDKIQELLPKEKKLFLKKDKAIELLKNEPPQRIIQYLKYHDVNELINREKVEEIYAAMRIFEDQSWMNDVFAKQYFDLTPYDFEKREIEMITLDQKWASIAREFLKKKYQNISHLKELGIIFVMPVELGIIGEITRAINLIYHYFYEINFYADLFEDFTQVPADFGKNVNSAIRVELPNKRLPDTQKLRWLILPKYLAKYDENDWRLSEPHISPEALFWVKAERLFVDINKIFRHKVIAADFGFWLGLDWVGDYFKSKAGFDVLVSFNLVDSVMALIRERELEKYLYHHQESLWNKIFIEYFGEEKLEKILRENFVKGFVEM